MDKCGSLALFCLCVVMAGSSLGCSAAVSRAPRTTTETETSSSTAPAVSQDVQYVETAIVDGPPPAQSHSKNLAPNEAPSSSLPSKRSGESASSAEPIVVDTDRAAKAPPDDSEASRSEAAEKASSPFGADTPLGNDPESAMGALMGGTIEGEGFGYGGLGVRGTGRGRGSSGGSTGLGKLGTTRHGGISSSKVGSSSLDVARPPLRRSKSSAGYGSAHVRITPNVELPPTRTLTAATVPDVDRRLEYLSYLSRHGQERSILQLDMTRRVRMRVVDSRGLPVHDAAIVVVGAGVNMAGRTRADGYWDLHPGVSAPNLAGQVQVYVEVDGRTRMATLDLPAAGDSREVHIRFPEAHPRGPTTLDLAFLIDATGSMGDELEYVTEELAGIVQRVRAAMPQVEVRVAATLYRDRIDRVPLQQIPFTNDTHSVVNQLWLVDAIGGGDYPEDMNAGLAAAMMTLDWSRTNAARVLVLIADAPPQPYVDAQYTYHHALSDASARGIRILPVAASGADRTVEYLLRAMGAFTGTPYVYLTDDSGVGAHHMEADTDRINVEMFSDLLTRMLVSDLQGHGMHEPELVVQQPPSLQLTQR